MNVEENPSSMNNQGNLPPIQDFGLPQQPTAIEILFDDICDFIKNHQLDIEYAAGLAGGWEGWLQAALAVYLNELENDSKYDVVREAKVYSAEAEAKASYRHLRGLFDKIGSNRALRADLAVKTMDLISQHIVIELKCESLGMSELAKLVLKDDSPATKAQRDELTSNYITLGVTHDAMKLELGFAPAAKVHRACICAVTFSTAGAMQLDQLKKGEHGYKYNVPNSTIAVYMWHVAVKDGKWFDDGHAPHSLVQLLSYRQRQGVAQVLKANPDIQEAVLGEDTV